MYRYGYCLISEHMTSKAIQTSRNDVIKILLGVTTAGSAVIFYGLTQPVYVSSG